MSETLAVDGSDDSLTETVIGRFWLLTNQLFEGCHDDTCRNQHCATGRRNNSQGVPTRDYTLRTAKTIALHLLDASGPSVTFCLNGSGSTTRPSEEGQGPRDPSSFVQHMSDSLGPAMDRVREEGRRPESPTAELWAAATELELLLAPPFIPNSGGTRNPSFVSDTWAALRIGTALELIHGAIPPNACGYATWNFVAEYINNAQFMPGQTPTKGAPEELKAMWLNLFNYFEFEPVLALGAKVCECVAFRYQVEDILARVDESHRDDNRKSLRSTLPEIISDIARRCSHENESWTPWPYPLLLKRIFLLNWDGGVMILRGTVASGALELMETLKRIQDGIHHKPAKKSEAYSSPFIAKRLDAVEAAEKWVQMAGAEDTMTRHIFDYPFVFHEGQLLMYFRTTCHIRMRAADTRTRAYESDYRKVGKLTDLSASLAILPASFSNELKYVRASYLLLRVSRENVLQDAFDQLWQRHKKELERPLRVRMGENDNRMEMGQDLGGVQIEFFSVLCRKAFEENTGMFATDPVTSLSWFISGSLEPLHMFELFGLLMALALYNGITVPVSFPLILYKRLLGKTCEGIADIRDGWPADARALESIQRGEVEVDYEFPMEANGLRLSLGFEAMRSLKKQSTTFTHNSGQLLQLRHNDISLINASDSTTSSVVPPDQAPTINHALPHLRTHHWPGWNLRPHYSTPPQGQNADYCPSTYSSDYALWLTTISILPQLVAFTSGFHTLLPATSLRLFTPTTLKSTLEGYATLNLKALRRSATYDGYNASEPYILSFWHVLGTWDQEMQKGLLKFVTAAERVPISGGLSFKISRVESDRDMEEDGRTGNAPLPTSSTCFGTLLLPRYSSEEELEGKLRNAIEYAGEGFGIV